jgi:hypothetical protein
LRIFAALSVGVEINFLNASLPIQSRLRVPDFRPQLNFAKFLHDNAAPTTNTRRNGPQSTVTGSTKLITECVSPALLALAQQVRTEQPRMPFVHGRHGLFTGTSRAQKRVDLVPRFAF